MDLEALKQAVLGANNVTAPGASPNSTGANAFAQSAIGHIQNLATISQRNDASGLATNALYGGVKQQSAVDAANAQAAHDAAVAAARKKAEEEQQIAKDLADPNKYTRAVNKTGGYDFYAPDGTQISPNDYAQVKGIHTTDAVKGSQDTNDQKFIQDYKNVQDLGEQVNAGTLADYLKKHPEVKKQLDSAGLKDYASVVKNFRSSYPQYFPKESAQSIGNSPTNNTPLQPGGGGNLIDKLKSLFGA